MCVQWHLSFYFQYCHHPFCHHQINYCIPISAFQYLLLELCHVIVYTASITLITCCIHDLYSLVPQKYKYMESKHI